MSQSSGGGAMALAEGLEITVTFNAASAFGDDLTEDSFSVTGLSQYKERRRSKSKDQNDTFGRSRLTRLEREESVQQDSSQLSSNDEEIKEQQSSSSSPDHSDNVVGAQTDDAADVNITNFISFGQKKFQMKTLPTYSCSALPQPLLPTHDKANYLAALASWVTILRIMGDLPDEDKGNSLLIAGTVSPVTSQVKSAFKTKYSKKDVDDAHKKYSELFKDPLGTDSKSVPFLFGNCSTMLDKIQTVCAIGIYKPNLRDELYCQVCKQLTNNPSRNSTMRGWVLLSLIASSFAPSENFAHIFTNFLSDGLSVLSEKVDRILRRTCNVGTRAYPPTWLEFQAAKNSKPLLIPVTFMNGRRMLFEVDAAMTVAELVRNIGERLDLMDISGYSMYISLQTKILCLGHGMHRIMDAIAECEQNTKQMGLREGNTIWRVYFRREYFSPWYMPGEDPVDTDLVYQQIKRGITMGEYRIDKEEVLLNLTAKVYYVEYPDDLGYYNMPTFINAFIPGNRIEKKTKEYYQNKVQNVFEKLKLGIEKPDPHFIKADIIKYAKAAFYILFSRYYDVAKVVVPNLHLISDLVVGVNSQGIYVVDNADVLKLKVDFSEIVDISKTKHHLTLGVANMDDIVFSTNQSDDFFHTVSFNIEELKRRSTVAIAKQDFTQSDGSADCQIMKGDLLELSQSLSDLGDQDTITSLCTRTNKPCDIPVKLLYIIPTTDKPSEALIERLTAQICKNAEGLICSDKQQYSLQQYAKKYFRQVNENMVTKFLSKASLKRKDSETLWKFSTDALKKPLLKRTCNRDDIKNLAIHCFDSIQKYMNNQTSNDDSATYSLCSQWILSPAQRNKYLREEIYCQIVKQLTNNPEKSNCDRGWQLLALLTSLTPPSSQLVEHILAFLQSSSHPLAKQCEVNIKTRRRRGGNRLYPSHQLEHKMISQLQPSVTVQVYLPDKSVQTLDITSSTLIFQLKKEIANRLHLKSFHEYNLFLTALDKVHCLTDRTCYFDCLSHAEIYWLKQNRKNSVITKQSYSSTMPTIVMLKKIWVNKQPGIDLVADKVFHFPQEMPNYLRGYHQMPDELVTKLSALMYIVLFGNGEITTTKVSEALSQIIPADFLKGKTVSDVANNLTKEIQLHRNMTSDIARTVFLQELSRLTTYGAVFCEAKQHQSKFLPTNILVAINYSGIHIIDASTKTIIKTYKFESIPNWACDERSFTLIVVESGKTTKILMETTVGHNMDDLIISYVAWIMNLQMRKKGGFGADSSGESVC